MTDGTPALRVLHLLLWIVPGGGGTQSYRRALLDAFAGAGDVCMLGAALHPGVAEAGFAEPPHLGRGGSRWRNLATFCRYVWRMAPGVDLVQIHGLYGPQFLLGAPLCWLRRVPYLVNPHGALSPWFLSQARWRARLFLATVGAWLLRRAAAVLTTCELETRFIPQRFPGVRVALVRSAVDVPLQPRAAFLVEPPEPELRLLYLGSFDAWKRVPLLLRALAAVRAEGIDARLTLCGQGPPGPERSLRDDIARLGLAGAVTLPGYVTGAAKDELLRRAHLLVQPSVTESYSFAVVEALAQGVPVVVTVGAGPAPDVLRNDCGRVVPIDDPAALAAALRELADLARRRACGLNAHRFACSALSLRVLRGSMTELYREFARP